MVDDGHVHGPQDAVRDRGRARNLQKMAAGGTGGVANHGAISLSMSGRGGPGRQAQNHKMNYECKIQNGQRNRSLRSEEHTSELQSLMRISYAVFCLKKK